jgi:ATP-dependent DNA helicase RecQ
VLKVIEEELCNLMNEEKTIYILKGFDSIINNIELKYDHIFDLGICDNLMNVFNVDDNSFMICNLEKLKLNNIYWCLYEELIYTEKKSLYGLISASGYQIKIIDIGCFDYYYPGIQSKNINETIKKFEEETPESNMLQRIYTSMENRSGNLVISYNMFENEKTEMQVKLIRRYSEYFDNKPKEVIKETKLYDNSTSEEFVQVFNEIIDGKYNTIKFIKIEGKDEKYIKKFLFILNYMGINIIEEKREKNYVTQDLYDIYLEVLKRKNPEYNFRKIPMYKDPFESNEMEYIDQSVIIDTIYQNILKAQKNESFKDIFVTAPTGSGKSILFQIPAIVAAEKNDLLTIVISPLIGLMKDQVNNIKPLTNCAATINSEYTPIEKEQILENIKNKKTSILYISPESLLSNADIETFIGDRQIGLLVIDEAHTVSTWGKNFRPDYWNLGDYLNKLRHRTKHIFPIATFTATATISNGTEDMYHDIVESLNLTCDTFFGEIKRKDIKFHIYNHLKDHAYKEEKDEIVKEKIDCYVKDHNDKTLVYFPTIRSLQEMAENFSKSAIAMYHGKMDKIDKDEALEDIRRGNKNVILATKAFGMGIDIEDIKNVYHFAPTGNLADYVQEIGRAARKPGMDGIASTDFYEEDFRYINRLEGMSQITVYNIIGVLMKILYKYKIGNRRNFLVSVDEFSHVFQAKNDDEIESKLKATIIAIKRDFKNMSNYVPLIFTPRSMFTKGLFFISDSKMQTIERYGWKKYLELKYDRNQLEKMDISNEKTIYMGDLYIFDFKQCWLDHYNGKYDGMSFGNFKRKFYLGELPGIDRTCFNDRTLLKLSLKLNSFNDVKVSAIRWLNIIKSVLDDMKMSNKHYTPDEIAELIMKKGASSSKTKVNNLIEPLLNLLISYDYNYTAGRYKFCDYNSKTNRYHIVSSYYDRTIQHLKNAIEKMLDLEEQNNEIIMVINTNKDDNKKMRSDPVLIAAQILELLDLTSYTFERGNSLEFFVRVNSEYLIQKVLDNHLYKSKTLATIQKLHHDSVRYMSYFFTKLESDDERWQFIEDYFLGRVENKYKIGDTNLNIKKMDVQLEKIRNDNNTYKSQIIDEVKLYELYSEDQNENLKLYIYDTKIEELEEMEYMKISPEALVAKKLIDCKQGDDFSINDFNYLIMKIDNYELKNEIKIDE